MIISPDMSCSTHHCAGLRIIVIKKRNGGKKLHQLVPKTATPPIKGDSDKTLYRIEFPIGCYNYMTNWGNNITIQYFNIWFYCELSLHDASMLFGVLFERHKFGIDIEVLFRSERNLCVVLGCLLSIFCCIQCM